MRLVEPGTEGAVEVTVWDLAMDTPPAGGPGPTPDGLVVLRAEEPAPELSAFFYGLVGREFHWVDRADWPVERWADWVDRPEHHLHTCWWRGAPAGYVEFEEQADGLVEIAYFGLGASARGRGLGRWWLEYALAAAWERPGTRRVWLHTCSLDGPRARPNYLARGFVETGVSSEWRLPG